MIAGRLVVLVAVSLVLLLWFDLAGDIAARDSFSWMDPEQYYSFARDFRQNGFPDGGFPVASIFPAFVAPFAEPGGGPSDALRANGAFLVLLAVASFLLVRSAGGPALDGGAGISAAWAALAAPVVLAAPLLSGLARELYSEYALAALVAFHLWVWIRTGFDRIDANWVLFALLTAVGLLTKMTYPIFLAGGFLVEAVISIRRGRGRRLVRVALGLGLPALGVLLAIRLFLPESFSYYMSFGNTRIPIMRLIGPPDLFSLDSLLYYPRFLLTAGLGWLAPLVVLLLLAPLAIRTAGGRFWNRPRALLLATVVAPLIVLTAQAVKEPRHIAPCIAPAIVLAVIAASRLTPRRRALSMGAALLLVAAGQYLDTRTGGPPYRLDAPLAPEAVERAMVAASPEAAAHTSPSGRLDAMAWRYTQSIAIRGFDANEALALTWYFRPAVVFNLDLEQWAGGDGVAWRRFEDLYYFAAFNSYNARCGWKRFYSTLSLEETLEHADFLVAGSGDLPAGYDLVSHEGGTLVARNRAKTARAAAEDAGGDRRARSFRELYARRYLDEGEARDGPDLSAVWFSLFMEERLRGRIPEPEALRRGFPEEFTYGERRNIYWMNVYGPLVQKTESAIRAAGL